MPNNYLPPTESQSLITELVFENDVEGLKYELAPPSKPKFTLNAFDSITLPSSLYSTLGNRSDFLEELANISGPIIERTTNGYTITYKIKKLVQHQPEKDFEPFLLWLDNIDKPTLWEVPVKIVSASLPEPKKDTLYIQINPNV